MVSQQFHPAVMAPNGGLMIVPQHAGGEGQVTINFARSPQNELTAIIAFGGRNQALVTFDAFGTAPVSYSLYGVAQDMFVERSVCNIMQQLSGLVPSM